jgi:DNA-binding transcriptional LysR family regulator
MNSADQRYLSGLPVLAAVLKTRSFVRAGNALGLSQSGVSRAVQRLEERLGIRLFERTAKMVKLTEDGNKFCQEALPLLAQLEEVAQGVQNVAGSIQGLLRVNVDPTFARLYLAPRIGKFLEKYPGINLQLAIRDRLGDLVADGFDAAIRFGYPAPSALISRRLLQVRIFTCCSPDYLKRRGRPKTPQDIATQGHECLHFTDPQTGMPFPWEFYQGKKKLKIAVSGRLIVDDALTHLEACLAGNGIAQLMELSCGPLIASGKLVNLFPEWSDELFPLYLFHTSKRLVLARLKVFTDFIVATASSI